MQHVHHILGDIWAVYAHARRGVCGVELSAGVGSALAYQRNWHQHAITGKYRIGAGDLEQAGRQAVPIRHGGVFDRTPRFPGTQPATGNARKRKIGLLPDADVAEVFPHVLVRQALSDLGHADVAGFLDDAADREGSVIVHVTNGCSLDGELAGVGGNHGLWRDLLLLQRQGNRYRLHG